MIQTIYNDADQSKNKTAETAQAIDKILFKHRILTLFGEITDKTAQLAMRQLLAFAYESDDPITIYISSPGGHVESGDVIFDVIRSIQPKVRTVGAGWVGSIASHIFLATEKDNRYCLPNTRFLIHQPAGGMGGTASDVQIHAKEILKTRERINNIIAQQTGQSIDKVNQDTLRDYWMSARESVKYGMVGHIIDKLSALN